MRSRRDASKRIKILVDTSFPLPALGMKIERKGIEAIRLFRFPEIYYLEIALLEDK